MEEICINSLNVVSASVHTVYHMIAVISSTVSSEKSGEERWVFVCLFV